jgi:hypothetical protein
LFAKKFKKFLAAIAEQDFFNLETTRITRVLYAQCRDLVDGEWPEYRRVEIPACFREEQILTQDGQNCNVGVYWIPTRDLETGIGDEVFSLYEGDCLADCDTDYCLAEVITFERHASEESPAFVRIVTKMYP